MVFITQQNETLALSQYIQISYSTQTAERKAVIKSS